MVQDNETSADFCKPGAAGVSQENDTRPEPYANPAVALHFRNGHSLYIPGELLKKYPRLASQGKSPTDSSSAPPEYSESHLSNVPLAIGHVLIHFLITGSYQCLKPKQATDSQKNASEFTTALRVYSAAKTFNLTSLVDLSGGEIRRLGNKLSLPCIIDIMEGEDENPIHIPWVAVYLESRVQSFLAISSRAAAKQLLSELETPPTTSKLILRSMIALRSRELPLEEELRGSDDSRADQSESSQATQAEEVKEDEESPKQSIHSSTIVDEQRPSPNTSLVFPTLNVSASILDSIAETQIASAIALALNNNGPYAKPKTKKQLKHEAHQKKTQQEKAEKQQRMEEKRKKKKEKREENKQQKEENVKKQKEEDERRDKAEISGLIEVIGSLSDCEQSVPPASAFDITLATPDTQSSDFEYMLLNYADCELEGELKDEQLEITFPTDEEFRPEDYDWDSSSDSTVYYES
ncbi:hypothetical protein G7Z17_g8354 [Cylindrodendrum hubeiense]|uniref:Uncharacterized protein n=1 Tax=Cylindrodendrum hubeiense TaxID=595255 RepID=A0A9P5L6L0_9HYPO|nr:hypothetical protein G7Z17_g8354 [Cylindrodendrum hubeiense]